MVRSKFEKSFDVDIMALVPGVQSRHALAYSAENGPRAYSHVRHCVDRVRRVWGLLSIANLLVGTEPTRGALYLAVAGGLIAVGLVKMRRYRREITAFAVENGPDAGKR